MRQRETKPDLDPVFIIDTREQEKFSSAYSFPGFEVVRRKIDTGDYSVVGLEDSVAVERKEVNDFIACCTHSRDRFERELARGEKMRRLFIVIEAGWMHLMEGHYRSAAHPHAIQATVAAWENRYQARILFAGNREGGRALTEALLRRAWVDAVQWKSIEGEAAA